MIVSLRKLTFLVLAFTVSVVLITPPSSSRSKQKVISWEAIREAWAAYLEYPSTENASKLYGILPKQNIDLSNLDALGHKVWDDIYGDYGLVAYEMLTGDANAVKVAFRLLNISDASFTEYIVLSLAQLIRIHPDLFLEELEMHKDIDFLKNVQYPLFAVDPSFIDRFKARKLELELRIKALESVQEKGLRSIRDECIRRLKEKIAEIPKT